MAVKSVPARIREGVYLEDGEALWRVLDATDGQVMLENCGRLDCPPLVLPVAEVLKRMRLVRRR